MRVVIAGLLAALLAVPVSAEESACVAAGDAVQTDAPLRHVAAAIDNKHLTVAVVGSASSSLPGPNGAAKAYPARLGDWLKHRLPGVDVKVSVHTQARESAAEMAKSLPLVLVDDKPDLVVWQTGTVDAMMGVDPDAFQSALDAGIEALHAGKADAVLMNMQYSPRTDSMIALGAYLDVMRHGALQHEVPLFDRLALMKNWNELGIFNLHADTRTIDVAEAVHDCISRLLVRLIVNGADLARGANTGAASPDLPAKDIH